MRRITPRFLRFAASGFVNTAVDFSVFALMLSFSPLGPFGANLVAFGTAVCCSFLLNRYWTFGDRRTGSLVPFVVWMSAIALSVSWLLALLVGLGVGVALAKIAVTALAVGISYQVMNRLVFRGARVLPAWLGGLVALAGAAALVVVHPAGERPRGIPDEKLALYQPVPAPWEGPRKVYHLGHSLVGRDMPAMLAQLAGEGHDYGLQLGWGTSLNQHLAGRDAIQGYGVENATPKFDPLDRALADPDYDALIFTEMIGLEAAIRYHDSADAVARLVARARSLNPALELYLYETWHPLDEGDWLARIAHDWETLWQPAILAPAIRAAEGPVTVIPAGTVMARLVEQIEGTPGGVGGMTRREDLFALDPDGQQDQIHINDWGAYLVALTHYAVLYGRSPEGLPHQLRRADGTPAEAPAAPLAQLMQQIVHETVQSSPLYQRQQRAGPG